MDNLDDMLKEAGKWEDLDGEVLVIVEEFKERLRPYGFNTFYLNALREASPSMLNTTEGNAVDVLTLAAGSAVDLCVQCGIPVEYFKGALDLPEAENE